MCWFVSLWNYVILERSQSLLILLIRGFCSYYLHVQASLINIPHGLWHIMVEMQGTVL